VSDVGGPGVGGVDVEVAEIGEDGGGEVSGESGTAGAAKVDGQVVAQGPVEGVAGGSSEQATGEQSVGAVAAGAGEYRGAGAVFASGVEQGGDRVRRQQPVLGHLQSAGAFSVDVDVVVSQGGDAADGQSGEQDERAGGADLSGQGLAVQAAG
jgi:hypothetical protein